MKNILCLLLVTLLFSCSSSKSYLGYTTRANNTLYRGVANPFIIQSTSKDSIEVAITNGTLIPAGTNIYNILVGQDKSPVVVTIMQGKKIEQIRFHIKDIPKPILMFRGKTYADKEIPVSEFKEFRMVSGVIPDFEYDVKFDILPFKITKITADDKVTHYNINDTRLPPGLMSGLAAGDVIIFYNMSFKTEGSDHSFPAEDCVFTLK